MMMDGNNFNMGMLTGIGMGGGMVGMLGGGGGGDQQGSGGGAGKKAVHVKVSYYKESLNENSMKSPPPQG